MWKVDIYLETDSTFQGKKHRRCGYVLATQLRTGEKTKSALDIQKEHIIRQSLRPLQKHFSA